MAVTPADIAVELGRSTPTPIDVEYAQWERWIADALMLISARLGDTSSLDQTHLDYVVRQAVAAHIKKPDDASQVAISIDDGSVSKSFRSSRGRVEIIDEWWALLSPNTESSRAAFSIRPSGSHDPHMPWCSLMFGATYCSCGADLTNYQHPLYEGGILTGDEY